MNRTAFRKTAQLAEQDVKNRDPNLAAAQNWHDRSVSQKPIAARNSLDEFNGVSNHPANDHGAPALPVASVSPRFASSRHFWFAVVATVLFCGLFAVLMGFNSSAALEALVKNPGQYSLFIVSMAVIGALQWLLAMAAHRQAVMNDMWRHMMQLGRQRVADHAETAEEAGWKLNEAFDRLFGDLDERLVTLDEKTNALSSQVTAAMSQTSATADLNIAQMRNILEATEVQREALQRSAIMISTEILPIVNKLESTVQTLETASRNAGGILGSVGSQLQQSTRDLQNSLEEFNRTNQSVAPEIEKRLHRFEAAVKRLPEQLEAGLSRLTPLSDTIADAAMLSTANIGVIEELGKDIAATLQRSRAFFNEFSNASKTMLHETVDAHLQDFRDQLATVIREEAAQVMVMSREINHLTETAASVVGKLQEPVAKVSDMANQALVDMQQSVTGLDEKIQDHLRLSIAQLNDAASQVVRTASKEIEAATIALQTRLVATSSDLVQRVNFDTARFENLITEVGDKSSNRIAATIRDIPAAVSQRLEQEIAKVDGSLQTSILGLSDQMRTVIDTIPGRLNAITGETIQSLETSLERSFEGVVERADLLTDKFKRNAAQTTDTVMASYVDFIYLAVDRFRTEMEDLNSKFSKTLALTRKPMPFQPEKAETLAD